MATVTKDQATAALGVVQAIAEAIRELGTVPSGELYARLMGRMTLDQYNQIIGILKGAGVVTESASLLKWVQA